MRPATAFVFLALMLALVPIALWPAETSPRPPQTPGISVAVYDGRPTHVWNRLYAALRVREDSQGNRYGEDSLDPMLWRESEHLLSQPSHGLALRVLDEFLRTHAETLIRDPLKRAMLQRDLWAAFDWSVQQNSVPRRPGYKDEKRALQARLAEVMRRLALTQEQIKSLPDNYAQAVASGAFAAQYDPIQPQRIFLPPDLFDPRGPWVCITPSPGFDWLTVEWRSCISRIFRDAPFSSSSCGSRKGAKRHWIISRPCGTLRSLGFQVHRELPISRKKTRICRLSRPGRRWRWCAR